ncbi:lipocalin family protein [Niabella aurantiaca]|uniref:lipocalin family protein n=1 Tax=Niabella aurantiaca TaxID=379900 RepID=UPI000364DE0D|nr:lipocalin family protein [Niabella aurantiaca]
MKKITYLLILIALAATLPNCYKGKQKLHLPDQILGLWSLTSFNYKAYKGSAIIEEYTEPAGDNEQITILFYKNGTFETYERRLEGGKWVTTEHVEGTCQYLPGTGILVMEDEANGERSEANVLTLTDQHLVFSQSVSPASHNPEADRETITSDFKRGALQ